MVEIKNLAEKEASRVIPKISEIQTEIDEIQAEIKALQEKVEELVEKKMSLEQELLVAAKLPGCDHIFDMLNDIPANLISFNNPIDCLKLSKHNHDGLKKIGINTISDILKRPFDDFYEIRNLEPYHLNEIIYKMHEIGYPDFGTADLKDQKTSIAYLELNASTYRILKEAGVNTIGDILRLDFDDILYSVISSDYHRNQIIYTMQEIGYPDFGLGLDD